MFRFYLVAILAATLAHAAKSARKIVGFGDSLTDVGNTFSLTKGAWPTNSLYPKHAFTDKVTWLSYVADELKGNSGRSLGDEVRDNEGSLRGSNEDDRELSEGMARMGNNKHVIIFDNHALGGATTDNSYINGFTGPNTDWPVAGGQQQLDMYLQKQSTQTGKGAASEYFFLWLGANDFFYQWLASKSISDVAFQTGMVNNIVSQVTSIASYATAQNKHKPTPIVVLNAYPIELVPFMQPYLTPDVNEAADKFNVLLANALNALEGDLTPDTPLVQVDVTTAIRDIVATAPPGVSKTGTCILNNVVCKDPAKFVFYDTFHPTFWVHKLIAKEVFRALNQ